MLLNIAPSSKRNVEDKKMNKTELKKQKYSKKMKLFSSKGKDQSQTKSIFKSD